MANRDDEVGPDEHHQVAGLDDLAVLGDLRVRHVPRGADHQEGTVAVRLELRPLAALDRVLDRERLELEDAGDLVQIGGRRFVQAEPDERVVALLRGRQGLGVPPLARLPDTVDVEAAVDHGVAGGAGSRCRGTGGGGEDPGHGPDRGRDRPADAARGVAGAVFGRVSHGRLTPCSWFLSALVRRVRVRGQSRENRPADRAGSGPENRHRVSRPQRGVGWSGRLTRYPVGAG